MEIFTRDNLFDTLVFTNSMMFRRDILKKSACKIPDMGIFTTWNSHCGYVRPVPSHFSMFRPTSYAIILDKSAPWESRPADWSPYKNNRTCCVLQRRGSRTKKNKYYNRNKLKVDQLIARLARPWLYPWLPLKAIISNQKKYYPKRARRYLALCSKNT